MLITKYDGNEFGTDYIATLMQGSTRTLPAARAVMTPRTGKWPFVSGLERQERRVFLGISIEGDDIEDLYAQLCQWLDPESETPKVLTATDDNGANERYLEVVCESLVQQDPGIKTIYVATLAVHDDVRWRASVADSDVWTITASGQTKVLTNGGTDDAYPVFQIKPTSTKSSGYTYKRWVPIKWLSGSPGPLYPVMFSLDTATLVGAGKMQADGDDLRVKSDGVELYRWLDAMNSAATKVWFNLGFAPGQDGTLATALAGSGTITAIELNEEISSWPSSGIVLIGTEAFVFTNKDTSRQMLTGITRAAKGTSMAAHAINDAVYWIQHDVWLLYGNAAASAPVQGDNTKPAFELDSSTNTSWVYETFGKISQGPRRSFGEYSAARWRRFGDLTIDGSGGCYSATQRTLASPFTVIGAWLSVSGGQAYGWYLENPCGIVNVAWSNGLKRRATTQAGLDYLCHLMYWPRGATWWSWMYTIPSPTLLNTWESWSYSGSAFSISDTVALALYFFPSDVEAGDMTVTLNSDETPVIALYAEQSTYTLDVTLENTTTSESLPLSFELELNQTLKVDTYHKTVTYLKDNSSQFQAIDLPIRDQWLKLQPGANTIKFTDAGTVAVTVTTTWKCRFF